MNNHQLSDFLHAKYKQYNDIHFIEDDPIKIPHSFVQVQDIEIAGLFASILAWGNRKTIIKNATLLMELMGNEPYNFIETFTEEHYSVFNNFKHRTFNHEDVITFILALQNIYKNYNTLGELFQDLFKEYNELGEVLSKFKQIFFQSPYANRSTKHLPDPLKGSAAKRMCMYLRWMTRKDANGVDFGIWHKYIPTNKLKLPLDVHTGNVGRALGLLTRKQNDWKAVEEITRNLKKYDANDPVKFDFALFGVGVNEAFK